MSSSERIEEKIGLETNGKKEEIREGSNVEVVEHKHVEVADDIPPELEELLHTDPSHGLTTDEALKRLEQFG
ncbi:28207_t:CDS:1, partial [Racocetra persica]